ncbi:MAG: hypothetical protein OEY36_03505 [Gammaproteobacteria bacterium]|nr:hypothetical protein [Gammaproteobacteria bacterium]
MYSGIITRISLSVVLSTALILLVMISIVLVGYDGNYGDFIQSQAISQKNMRFAIVLVSLLLIFITALISWLIGLYSSFRIAGPLYRFTQNLAHCYETQRMLNIRSDDYLQDLSKSIISAAKQLEAHKLTLLKQTESILGLLQQSAGELDKEKLNALLLQLKQLEARVLLDE